MYERHGQPLEVVARHQNDTTEYYNRRIEELKTDKNIIEQVAREQYLMSKPNEDIYLCLLYTSNFKL